TGNPCDLLIENENEDLSQLIAAQQKKVAASKTPGAAAAPAAAKLPSKPLPPAQAVRESRNNTLNVREGAGRGGTGRGRGGRGAGIGLSRDIGNANNNRYGSGGGGYRGGAAPEEGDTGRSSERERGSYDQPRGAFRGGRRGGFVDGNAEGGSDSDRTQRRVYERRSGTGRGVEMKREGAGRGNWGAVTDAQVIEESLNFDEKPVTLRRSLSTMKMDNEMQARIRRKQRVKQKKRNQQTMPYLYLPSLQPKDSNQKPLGFNDNWPGGFIKASGRRPAEFRFGDFGYQENYTTVRRGEDEGDLCNCAARVSCCGEAVVGKLVDCLLQLCENSCGTTVFLENRPFCPCSEAGPHVDVRVRLTGEIAARCKGTAALKDKFQRHCAALPLRQTQPVAAFELLYHAEMTLEEYEKVREEKRKALLTLKVEERKVEVDKDLQSMQQLSIKKANNDVFIKLGSDKESKKRDNTEKEERNKKVWINQMHYYSCNNFV
ncbi:RGG repeats nuclear RNA binding protein B-like, partial [Phalaenopsis equestris]|uniref:RGG repeats nuclear RNA binding protein B-like n=2 Tax=Phalaenopsis equestris TaxID=78828 RepID=UPI0009E2B5D9